MYYPLLTNSNNEIIWVPGLVNIQYDKLEPLNNNYIKISQEILNYN